MLRSGSLNDPRIDDCRRIAVALQLEFRRVDAARHVRGEDEEEVDFLGGTRRQRAEHNPDRDEKSKQAGS